MLVQQRMHLYYNQNNDISEISEINDEDEDPLSQDLDIEQEGMTFEEQY